MSLLPANSAGALFAAGIESNKSKPDKRVKPRQPERRL